MPATTYAPTGVARAPSPATASGGNGVSLLLPESTGRRWLSVTDGNCAFHYAARSWRAWAPAPHDVWQRFTAYQVPISPTASTSAEGRCGSFCDLLRGRAVYPILRRTRSGPRTLPAGSTRQMWRGRPRPRTAGSQESSCGPPSSCPITSTCCFPRCGIARAGRSPWWTFCSA